MAFIVTTIFHLSILFTFVISSFFINTISMISAFDLFSFPLYLTDGSVCQHPQGLNSNL